MLFKTVVSKQNSDSQSLSASATVMWVTRESVKKVDEVSEKSFMKYLGGMG
jgi:hypothetical protein